MFHKVKSMKKTSKNVNPIKVVDGAVYNLIDNSGMNYFEKRGARKKYNDAKYDIGVGLAVNVLTSAVCTTANLAGKGIVKTGELIGHAATLGVRAVKTKASEVKIKKESKANDTTNKVKKFAFKNKKKAAGNENEAVVV